MGIFSALTKTRQPATESKKKSESQSNTSNSDTLKDGVKDSLKDGAEDPLGGASIHTKMGENASKKAKIDKNEDPHPKGGSSLEKIFAKDSYERKNEERGKSIMQKCGTTGVEYTIKNYRDAFMDFAETEFSGENVDVYEAIVGGVPPRSIYKTWIETEIINLPGKVKSVLDEQASKDQFDMMDLDPVKKEIRLNLTDTLARFCNDKASIRRVGQQR